MCASFRRTSRQGSCGTFSLQAASSPRPQAARTQRINFQCFTMPELSAGADPNTGRTFPLFVYSMAEYIVPSAPSTRVRCPGTASLSTIAPTMKTKHAILSLAIAAFAALGAYVYWGEATQPAPQTSFLLLDGSSTSTQALQGKVTLVNFWATSCTTCVAEMPDIATTYNKYKDQGFDTLAVAMQYDPPQYVLNFAQSRQLPFKVALVSDPPPAVDGNVERLSKLAGQKVLTAAESAVFGQEKCSDNQDFSGTAVLGYDQNFFYIGVQV